MKPWFRLLCGMLLIAAILFGQTAESIAKAAAAAR